MKKHDVVQFIQQAVAHVEDNEVNKKKFAMWLKEKYNMAIKDIVIKQEDGFRPHLLVEYLNDDGKVEECEVNVEKYADKIFNSKKSKFEI